MSEESEILLSRLLHRLEEQHRVCQAVEYLPYVSAEGGYQFVYGPEMLPEELESVIGSAAFDQLKHEFQLGYDDLMNLLHPAGPFFVVLEENLSPPTDDKEFNILDLALPDTQPPVLHEVERTLAGAVEEMGWSESSQIKVLCGFITHHRLAATFDAYVQNQIVMEQELAAEATQEVIDEENRPDIDEDR